MILLLWKGGSDCRIELALRLAAVRMVVKPSDHCDLLVFGLVVWVYGSPVSEGLLFSWVLLILMRVLKREHRGLPPRRAIIDIMI